MIDRLALYFCILVMTVSNLSFSWPFASYRITSSFAESRGDHFHSGIDIISASTAIHPVDEGKLLFMWDHSLFPIENYPGGGNYRILEHKNGYYSVYMHLADNPHFETEYSTDDIVSIMGGTGHSYGHHLHLSIFEIKSRKFINGLTVMPQVEDRISPEIREAYVRVGDHYSIIKNNETVRLTKHYPLLIDISDSMQKGDRLGIFKLIVFFNGKKVTENYFTDISSSKEGLLVNGRSFDYLFDEKGYYKVENIKYLSGVNTVHIIATDYAGNESTKDITFSVNLDMQ